MHKNKVSLLMVQISFISILHLKLLKFKYLTIINFTYHLWFGYTNEQCSLCAESYTVSDLIDILD